MTDAEALDAFLDLSRIEGILPALESSHAVAFAAKLLSETGESDCGPVVINVSGRGDKDIETIEEMLK